MNSARYRIFDDAGDGGFLWDLRLPLTTHLVDGVVVEIQPGRSIDELRHELEQLLRDGYVEIYETNGPQGPVLRPDEAVVIINDDRNWYAPAALGEDKPREAVYCLALTETGREQLTAELAEREGRE